MEMNESSSQVEVDSSLPLHRISRKQKLASHMSKVCKEKLDAVQAKMSGIKKEKKVFSRQGSKTQGQIIHNGKLSKIKQKFLKHNPGKWALNSSKFVESKKYNVENGFKKQELLLTKVEEDKVSDDASVEDPLALSDVQQFVKKEEPYDDSIDEVTSDAVVKEEEPSDASMDEFTNDGDGLDYSLKYEHIESENTVWLKDTQVKKGSLFSVEKDPLALEEDDVEGNFSFLDYSNSFIWDNPDRKKTPKEDNYCIYCGYNTTSRSNLKKHIRLRHINSAQIKKNVHKNCNLPLSAFKQGAEDKKKYCFYCFHCSFFTSEPAVLRNHLIIYHKSNTPLFCSICDYETFFPHELNLHLMSVHSKEDYLPNLKKPRLKIKTKVSMSSNEKLESKMYKKSQRESIRKSQVTKTLSSGPKLKKIITNEMNQNCDFVGNNAITKEQTIIKRESKNSVVFCPHCSFSSNEPYLILIHLTNEHKKKLSCSQCPFVTSKPVEMQSHINAVHQRVYECSKCGYLITKLKDFQDHIKKKHYLRCSICSFSTYLLQHLEKHLIAVHTQNMDSLTFCLSCEYSTNEPHEMIEHLKTKHGSKQLSCSESLCGFIMQNHLDSVSETGQECSYCFYRSKDENEYIVHLAKNHVRKLPLKCNYCNFFTVTNEKLAKHISAERKKRKKFFCKFCHFSSDELNELKMHLLEKHKKLQEALKCQLCQAKCRAQKLSPVTFCYEPNVQEKAELGNCRSQTSIQNESYNIDSQNDNANCNKQLSTKFINIVNSPNKKNDHKQVPELIEILDDSSSDEDWNSETHYDSTQSENSLIEYCFICPICNFVATNKQELQAHASTHHMRKKLVFKRVKDVKNTLPENCKNIEHKEETIFRCFKCHYITPQEEQLKEHVPSKHFDTQFFCCSHCNFLSPSLNKLATHTKDKHEKEKTFLCQHCAYSSDRMKDLEEHLETKHNEIQRTFSCTYCYYETKILHELHEHVLSEHEDCSKPYSTSKETHSKEQISTSRRVFTCCHCNYSNFNPQNITHHVKIDHFHKRLNIFFCYFCDFYCAHFNTLNDHIDSKHETQKHFACPSCTFSTWNRQTFLKHLPSEHGVEFLFDCLYCNYRTASTIMLRKHIMKEHEACLESKKDIKIVYSCPLCERSIADEIQLQEHITLEHATMKFFCTYCSYCTDNQSKFECHVIKAHQKGINVCSCPHCDFITSEYSKFQNHVIKHNGKKNTEKETRVSILQVNLAQKQSKSIPIKIIFACSDCDYSANSSKKLEQHILNEHCHNQQSSSAKELNVYASKNVQDHFNSERIKQATVPKSKGKEAGTEGEGNFPITFCSFCDFGTDDPHELKQHKEDMHQTPKISLNENTVVTLKSQVKHNETKQYLEKLEDSFDQRQVKFSFDSPVRQIKYKTSVCKPLYGRAQPHKEEKTSKTINKIKNNCTPGLYVESILLEKEKTSVTTNPRNIILSKINANKDRIASTSRSGTIDLLPRPTIKLMHDRKVSISSGVEHHHKAVDKFKKVFVPSNSFSRLKILEKEEPNQLPPSTNLVKFSCYQCNFKTSNPFELQNHTLTNHK